MKNFYAQLCGEHSVMPFILNNGRALNNALPLFKLVTIFIMLGESYINSLYAEHDIQLSLFPDIY